MNSGENEVLPRQSVCTSKTNADSEVAADCTQSVQQSQREENRWQQVKRQRTEAAEASTIENEEGLTSVTSMAQKFIPQWIQSLSTSIAQTFNHLHDNINFMASSETTGASSDLNRVTLDPQIPDGQRLLSLGFQEATTKTTSRKGTAGTVGFATNMNT